MAIEIERKFLLKNDSWKDFVKDSVKIEQYYIYINGKDQIRIRKMGNNYYLTKKTGIKNSNVSRNEIEKQISEITFNELVEFAISKISKVRHFIPLNKKEHRYVEIDVYSNGLVTAEIELINENEIISLPSFLGKDITDDDTYSNISLSKNM